jgi:hypothetical protein
LRAHLTAQFAENLVAVYDALAKFAGCQPLNLVSRCSVVAAVVSRDCFFFVFKELSIHFVGQLINRRVHIVSFSIGKQFGTWNMGGSFRLMAVFFNI